MPRYLTVTALNRYLKFKFDSDTELQSILLKAEISNFKRHSRGHLYLTLKDDKSQASAVMFSSNAQSLNFNPKDGDKIIVQGYVSIYEPYGNYQVYITKMEIDGIGDLYLAYEKLKKNLELEGLFKEEYKKPLPKFPKTIGVITSKTGAAVRDIINIIDNRYPLAKIIIYPTNVQGIFAKDEIVKQIEKANNDYLCDCLIVGRGGGSIEDLWPFNEEVVARAIFNSNIPIISAVGHETDFTIADFVADKRASTPSHAAEICVPHHSDLSRSIEHYENRMHQEFTNHYKRLAVRLDNVFNSNIFKQPLRIIQTQEQKFTHVFDKLIKNNPKVLIEQRFKDVKHFNQSLKQSYRHLIEKKLQDFIHTTEKLEIVNPLAIMIKGYSLVKQNNQIKKSVKDIDENQLINVKMHDGEIECKIIEVKGSNHE